ncbi:MAG TPA: hypothetical protein VFS20_01510 [Longimicrobium sp.]|nr:hypothetical protein [Longimicrobium sp.]
MTALRFTLAAALVGITLAACGTQGPTGPSARTPGHRATTANDTTPTTSTTPPAPLNTEPTTPPPPPNDRGGQIVGSGS